MVDGKVMPVTVEEYKQRLSSGLVAKAAMLDEFRTIWSSLLSVGLLE